MGTRTGNLTIAFFNRGGRIVRMACALSTMGVAFTSNLHAATSAAAISATVVAPIAVTLSEPQVRSESALASGQLTINAGGELTYSVVVQSTTNPPAQGVLMTGTQTLAVASSLAEGAAGLAHPELANISVMIAYD